jgi:hypothetical protein
MKYSNYILEIWNATRMVGAEPIVYYVHKLNKENNLYFTIGSYTASPEPQTFTYSDKGFKFSTASMEVCKNSKFEYFDSIEQLAQKYFDIFL